MSLEHRRCTTDAEWRAHRRLGCGSSDAPVIYGLGYSNQSLFALWTQKVEGVEMEFDEATKTWLRRGQQMEPTILSMFEEEKELAITRPSRVIYSDGLLACTLDALTEDGEPVEAKNVSQWESNEWDVGPPLRHQIQSQHQQAVLDVTGGWIVGLIGGNDLRIHYVPRNDGFIESHKQAVEQFWRYVVDRIPPPVDGTEATRQALARYYPKDMGTEIVLPVEAADWDDRLVRCKSLIKRLEDRKTELENRIKAEIGDNAIGFLPGGGAYSWRTQHVKAEKEPRKAYDKRVLTRIKPESKKLCQPQPSNKPRTELLSHQS